MTQPPPPLPTIGDHLRLFFAIRVAPEGHAPLLQLQQQLPGDWRPVKPDQFHLTLIFLGQVVPSALKEVEAVGLRAVQGVGPCTIRLTRTTHFPDLQNPRVLVVRAESPGLEILATNLRRYLSDFDFDPKPFKAHVTVARAKGAASPVPTVPLDFSWTAGHLELIRSTLTGSRAEHKRLQSYVLLGSSGS